MSGVKYCSPSSTSSPPRKKRGRVDQAGSPLEYPYPSDVNVANFVFIKLSGKSNYSQWLEDMECLLKTNHMYDFVDGKLKNRVQIDGSSKKMEDRTESDWSWKRSDALVKAWIFGSLCEDVMDVVIGLSTANDVWTKLKSTYSTPSAAPMTNPNQAKYVPLYRATLNGDWKKAQQMFIVDRDALTCKLNDDNESPLHVAIGTCQNNHFVKELLDVITPASLPTLLTVRESNPLHHAAFVGNARAAEMLVKKNQHLLFLPDKKKCLPILRAIMGSHIETFLYLLDVTRCHISLSEEEGCHNPFEGVNGCTLLTRVITAGLWEVAFGLIKDYPKMATENNGKSAPLKFIAEKFKGYFNGKSYNFYQRFVYSHVPIENCGVIKGRESTDIENQETHKREDAAKHLRSCFHPVIERIYRNFWQVSLQHVPHIKKLQEEKVKYENALLVMKRTCEEVGKLLRFCEIREHYLVAINTAVKYDNCEVVEEIITYFPQAISTWDNEYPLIQLAIINRSERVYSFLAHRAMTNKHRYKLWVDEHKNNILHIAGKLAPIDKLNLVSGAALQMQRELQWFEEVKKIACPWHENKKNNKLEKPIMLFRREHKQLRKEGEEWMKKTADSYTITAALIITIVFAAAITVPGGTDDNTGKTIYATKPSFIIFAVSDAISLFTSTTSLLLFLSILTARYAEEDFHHKLPKRLIFGLTMLFLSVTSMMVAFSATLYLMFGQGKAWILIPIAILTCLPIASFVTLQLPLLVDLISSTYGRGIFVKRCDRRIKQS
ncbi:hypothetical protein Lser_V15G03229 [Lactuca serriola]